MKKYLLSFGDQINAAFNIKLPYVRITLAEPIRIELMQEAVNEALAYHPTFKTSIIKERGLYYLEELTADPIVRSDNWKEDILFRNTDTNGYPWIISCHENAFIFTGAHAIGDGGGINFFLETVLRLYLEKTGVRFENTFALPTPEEAALAAEEPFAFCADRSAVNPFPTFGKSKKKIAKIAGDRFEADRTRARTRQFVFDEKDIKALARETETTTFAVLSSFLAKGLANAAGLTSGYVGIMVPANLRVAANHRSDRGFASTSTLMYDVEKGNRLPLDIVATGFRSQLDIAMDKDYLKYQISEAAKRGDFIRKFPFLLGLLKLAFKNMIYGPDAKLVYTHMVRPGFHEELLPHIVDFEPISGQPREMINLALAATYDGHIKMNIFSILKNDSLTAEIAKALDAEGVPYELHDADVLPTFMYLGE